MLTHMPVYHAGGGFPWGLLILGGIVYFLWHKGVIGGPGRHSYGPRHGGYAPGSYPPAPPIPPGTPGAPDAPSAGFGPAGPGFRGPREYFAEWHREAHAADAPPQAPSAPPAAAPKSAPTPQPATPGSEEQAR